MDRVKKISAVEYKQRYFQELLLMLYNDGAVGRTVAGTHFKQQRPHHTHVSALIIDIYFRMAPVSAVKQEKASILGKCQ